MTDEFDLFDEMAVELDDLTIDMILVGGTEAGDLPPSLRRVAALAEHSRRPATRGELSGETETVAAMVAAHRAAADELEAARRRKVKRRAMQGVAIGAFVLLSGTAAAAANRLPDPVQNAISDAGERVGLHIPKPKHKDKDASSDESVDATGADNSANGNGPDPNGPAKGGLCTAYAARGPDANSNAGGVAANNLESAASSAGQTVEQFCADAVHGQSDANKSTKSQDDATEGEEPETDSQGGGGGNSNSDVTPGSENSTNSSSAKKPEGSPGQSDS